MSEFWLPEFRFGYPRVSDTGEEEFSEHKHHALIRVVMAVIQKLLEKRYRFKKTFYIVLNTGHSQYISYKVAHANHGILATPNLNVWCILLKQ